MVVLDLFFCHPEFISGSRFFGVFQKVEGKETKNEQGLLIFS